MRVQDQIHHLASKLEANQAPVTVDEIMSGVNATDVFGEAGDDGVGRARHGWMAAAAAVVLLVAGIGGLWLVDRGDSSRIEPVDSPVPSTTSAPATLVPSTTSAPATPATTAPQVTETVSSGAAAIGETITFDDGGKARVNGVIRDAPARNLLYRPLTEGMTSTEIEVEHCIGGEDYDPTLNWQPPERWLVAERWSGILDDGTKVEARAGYYMLIESRPGACSRGYVTVPTPSGSNVVAMTLNLANAGPVEQIVRWDLSRPRPIEAPLQPATRPEAGALGEPINLPMLSHFNVTVLEVIDNATPKPSAADLHYESLGEAPFENSAGEPTEDQPTIARKLVEIRAEVCTDPSTEPSPPGWSYSFPEELMWLIETSDHYVGNAGGETYNGWEWDPWLDPRNFISNPGSWSPGLASTLVFKDRPYFSEVPAPGECVEGYVQIDLPDDAVPADVIITIGDGHFNEIGRIRLGE